MLYSDQNDPVTKILLEESENLKDVLKCVSIGEILENVAIHDVIEQGIAKLNWTMKDGSTISNEPGVKLVNRVFGLDRNLFNEFHDEDREYAYQEFWAYLAFAIESFTQK